MYVKLGDDQPGRILEMSPKLHAFPSKVPFSQSDSPSRRDMAASQLSQSLVIKGASFPRIMGGREKEDAIYTHRIEVPERCSVRQIIHKHPVDKYTDYQPDTLVVVEFIDNPGHFDAILVPYHHSTHPQFGFRYQRSDIMNNLRIGTELKSGTILAHSPQVDLETGLYKSGIGLNVVLMTSFEGIEDGMGIADDKIEALTTNCYKTLTVGFGTKVIPTNLMGDPLYYKIMQDISEYLGPEGILLLTRKLDNIAGHDRDGNVVKAEGCLSIANMDITSLMDYDHFDTSWIGEPGARIVGLDVIKTHPKDSVMLSGMEVQLEKYRERTLKYHRSILKEYERIKKEPLGDDIHLTPRFTRIIREALAIDTTSSPSSRLILTRNKAPLDEWEVRITYEYELTASHGTKMSDGNGGKVVDCRIIPAEHMPYDEFGVRADVIMLEQATANRMNGGRELYMASTCAGKRLEFELADKKKELSESDFYQYAIGRILKLYNCIDPLYEQLCIKRLTRPGWVKHHVDLYLEKGLYIGRNYDTNKMNSKTLDELETHFDIRGTKLTYIDFHGRRVTTKKTARIAELQMYVLEKVADSAAATASAKMQHFNIPANPSKIDKLTSPSRDNATKIFGETETRIITTNTEKGTLREILDQTNNIVSHTSSMFNLLEADNPMDLEYAVDRDKIPSTGGRIKAITVHIAEVAGIKLNPEISDDVELDDELYRR